MKNWTEQQRQAIEAEQANLLVSAAAGSGKTAVLVERIIRLLTQPVEAVDIDRLLVVTFTKAAAGEMRERIGHRLNRRLTETGLPVASVRNIRRQMQLLSAANISTLHAFCLEIVRQYFYLLDLDPKFTLLGENEILILQQQTWESVLEEEYAERVPEFMFLLQHLGISLDERPLYRLLNAVYAFMQSQPYPLPWLREKTDRLAPNMKPSLMELLYPFLREQARLVLQGAYENLQWAAAVAADAAGLSSYQEVLAAELDMLAAALAAAPDQSEALLAAIRFNRLPRADRDADAALKQSVQNVRNEVKSAVSELQLLVQDYGSSANPGEFKLLYQLLQGLYHVEEHFSHAYQAVKKQKGALDFNDLEHYALQILEHEEAAADFRRRFDYIFVDEYQDSNAVQEALLQRIARPDNLFMVGDVKQSIYRFRQADPTLFIHKYQDFIPDAAALNRRIDLQSNFRSRPEIIAGINRIFRTLMSESMGEIVYDEAAELHSGLPAGACAAELPWELTVISSDTADDLAADNTVIETDENNESVADLGTSEAEAHYLAERIQALLQEQIYDVQTGKTRPVKYSDIVILLRSPAGRASVFTQVFHERDIPLYADVGESYFRAPELEVFVNLLRIIDNKRQDIPLLSVLRSPIGGFTTAELLQIRLLQKKGDFWACMQAGTELENWAGEALADKLRVFMLQLAGWQEDAKFTPLDELICKLWDETGYYDYVGGLPAGRQRQANLQFLWEQARSFMAIAEGGLFRFLEFIEAVQMGGRDLGMPQIINENDDVVRLLSVHKSKGLEFPVVIVAGLGSRFNLRDLSAEVLLHKDLGVSPLYTDTDRSVRRAGRWHAVMKNKLRQESLSEELRILYVALTRAQQKLILLGSVGVWPRALQRWQLPANAYNLLHSGSPLDWLGKVLTDVVPVTDWKKAENGETLLLQDEAWNFSFQLLRRGNLQIGLRRADQRRAERLEWLQNLRRLQVSADLAAFMEWRYPYQQAAALPAKLSVTGVIREMEADREWWPARSERPLTVSLEETAARGLSGMAYGALLHRVLSCLDWQQTDAPAAIKQQLRDMCAQEIILSAELEQIDTGIIYGLACSELGKRIRAARRLYREAPFTLRMTAEELGLKADLLPREEILLQGIIDLYFYEDDGSLVLVDYKTDHIVPEAEEEMKRRYGRQIKLYRLALERITQRQVKTAGIYLLPQQRWVEM